MKKQNCTVILSKGPRKGEECGRTHCRHSRYSHEKKKTHPSSKNKIDRNAHICAKREFNLQIIRNRKRDIHYRCSQVLINQADNINNVPFTPEDCEKKREIFGVQNDNECFITGANQGVKTGDHIKEIRGYSEYYKKLNKYKGFTYNGSNSKWNTAPVSITENKKYKKIGDKDIGREKLTSEEYEACTENQKQIYNKLIRWEDYATSRGAKMYQLIPNDVEDDVNMILDAGFEFLEKAMNIICEKHKSILMDEDERIHGDFERKLNDLKSIIQSFDANH